MPGSTPRMIISLSLSLLLVLLFLPQFLSLYIDWLWFKDLNFVKIFLTRINAQAMTGTAGLLTGFLIAYVNLWYALHATKGRALAMSFANQAMPQLNILKHLDSLKFIVPLGIGAFAALLMNNNWMKFLYYYHRVAAGYADPIFNKDISFYLFTLPAYETAASVMMFILTASLVISGLVYLLRGAVFPTPTGFVAERTVYAHLSVLGALIFFCWPSRPIQGCIRS